MSRELRFLPFTRRAASPIAVRVPAALATLAAVGALCAAAACSSGAATPDGAPVANDPAGNGGSPSTNDGGAPASDDAGAQLGADGAAPHDLADSSSDSPIGADPFPAPFDVSTLPSSAPYGHVLYLDFSGAALAWDGTSNAVRNTSRIRADHANIVVPPFFPDAALDGSHPTRDSVIADVAARVAAAYAAFDVQVVTRRPPLDAFATIVVGGRNADLGRVQGAYGVATPDFSVAGCTFSPRASGFAMTGDWLGAYPAANRLAELGQVATHEAGHLFGLVHTAAGLGGYMDADSLEARWSNGATAMDSANSCARAQQDDVAVLSAGLGPHQSRPAVPPPPDVTPPSLVVVSAGAASPTSTAVPSCVTVSDASPIQLVMRQVLLLTPSGEFVIQQDARFAAPFTFPTVNIGEGQVVRYVAVDRWDNLSEARVTFHVDPSAPAFPVCP